MTIMAAAQLKEMFYGSSAHESMDQSDGEEMTTFKPLAQKINEQEITSEKAHGVLANVAQEQRTLQDHADMLDESKAATVEEVKHLDLAVLDKPAEAEPPVLPTSSPSPEPLSSGLVQRIEEIRRGGEDSKIPRLAERRRDDTASDPRNDSGWLSRQSTPTR